VKKTNKIIRAGYAALLGIMLAGPTSLLAADDKCGDLRPMDNSRYSLSTGTQSDLRFPVRIERIAVGDPDIADIQMTGNASVLMTARKAGVTSLLVWTKCSSDPIRASVQVTGQAVASASSQRQSLGDLPAQVQTDIRFVEVSRSKLKDYSSSIFGTGKRGGNFAFSAPGGTGTFSPGTIDGMTPTISIPDTGFNILWSGGSSRVLGMLNALESNGFAYTLAQPSLVALSGQSANFLAGGEYPIPVPQGNGQNITIDYKEYGVRLSLTPTILGENQIILKVAPEVSELDYSAGLKINSIEVPALRVRRTDTTVSLGNGESFIVSGLISKSTLSQVDRLPWLGSVPILGAFFRSSNIRADDRELLMVVTPHLVKPLKKNVSLPEEPGLSLRNYDPGFTEFYFMENGNFDRRWGFSGN
jgi:pilus assembly protein CpaC